jgi:hypothetical protein
VKRLVFNEHGISFEFAVNLVPLASTLGKALGKKFSTVQKAQSKLSKAGNKLGGAKTVAGNMVAMLFHFIFQVSLSKNKVGHYEFLIDAPSLRNIPNIFGSSEASSWHSTGFENGAVNAGLGGKREQATSTYIFGYMTKKNTETGYYQANVCLLGTCWPVGDPIGKTSKGDKDKGKILSAMSESVIGRYSTQMIIFGAFAVLQGKGVDAANSDHTSVDHTGHTKELCTQVYKDYETCMSDKKVKTLAEIRSGSKKSKEKTETPKVENNPSVPKKAQTAAEVLKKPPKTTQIEMNKEMKPLATIPENGPLPPPRTSSLRVEI